VQHRQASGVRHCDDISADARKGDQIELLICPSTSPPEPAPQVVYVSDGRNAVGTVEHVGDYFIAIDLDGHIIGRFHDLKTAVRALPEGGAR
jgi:hypothetical protein